MKHQFVTYMTYSRRVEVFHSYSNQKQKGTNKCDEVFYRWSKIDFFNSNYRDFGTIGIYSVLFKSV